MYKAVVFDLNGVFLQSELLTKRIEDTYGIPVDESLFVLKESMKIVRLNSSVKVFDFWKVLFEKYDINMKEEDFLKFWFEGERLVPELIDLSQKLRKNGIKVYILSNNFKERTEYYRKNFQEIFKCVDETFFSWETGFVKSEKRAYKNFLKQTNFKPSEVIYFDDSEENIILAKTLGIEGYMYEGIEKTKAILIGLF